MFKTGSKRSESSAGVVSGLFLTKTYLVFKILSQACVSLAMSKGRALSNVKPPPDIDKKADIPTLL